jgi:hypothetical protein
MGSTVQSAFIFLRDGNIDMASAAASAGLVIG